MRKEQLSRYSAKEFLELFGRYKYMASFEAYCDETGTDGRSPIIIVGGAVARTVSWANIMDEWNDALGKHDLKYFHYKEIKNKKTALGRLNDGEKDLLLSRLAGVLSKGKRLIWFGWGIEKEILNDLLMKEFPEFKRMTPYMLGAEMCFTQIGHFALQGKNIPPIPIIFDQGQKTNSLLLANARRWFGLESFQKRFGIGGLMFDEMEKWPQLQIADFIVGESRRAHEAMKLNKPVNERFIRLGENNRGAIIIPDAYHIRKFIKPQYGFWLNYLEQKRKRRAISSSS